jgi:predicted enzyme related to lactoylglutathione lyase
MIQKMNFLGLVVDDLEATTRYYTEKLGLPVDEQESIPGMYTQFKLGGDAILGLVTGFEQEGIDQSFDAALAVDDIDATYTHWREAGVETLSEPRDMPFGRTFLFRTPGGHVLRAYAPPASDD